MQDYQRFLESKIKLALSGGFDIADEEIHPALFPHQRDCVRWAVKGGNRALFQSFGLGKSIQQIEWMRIILTYAGGMGLIVAPLGVRQELIRDGLLVGVQIRFIRLISETDGTGIYITNYETVRDGKLDPADFTACSLDEASCLRSYGSKTYQEFLPLFNPVKYKLVNTATPSPNRFKELIHYAGFLGIMDTGQALMRFFKRDSTQANNLTLYPHKEQEFWLWVSSWAIFVQRPSDLGYSDEGYDLPALEVVYHEVPSNYDIAGFEKDGQGMLLPDIALGITKASAEKRDSMAGRIAKACQIVNESPDDHFVLWHDLENERHAIQKALPDALSVWGSQSLEEREKRIVGFGNGEFRMLSTKPIIAGSGCNFQRHCHRQIFVGIGFKFNDFIQAVHRCQRFQQRYPVRIDVIYSEAEREVLRALQEKWAQHNQLVENMTAIIKKFGLNHAAMSETLRRSIGVQRVEVTGDNFRVVNNDCVAETRSMEENSVGLIVTSIPFANHYEYTPSYNDFGHTENNDQFWAQMDFLTPELKRVLWPGRLYCCHVKDRILFGNVTGEGVPTVSPFHAEALFHGLKHGFQYLGMITVNTDVVRENNQTYRLGYTEMCKDGTKMGVGSPEYILLFRKQQTDRSRGYADLPVFKDQKDYSLGRWQFDADAFWRSSGNRLLTAQEMASYPADKLVKVFTKFSLEHVYDHEWCVNLADDMGDRLPRTFKALSLASNIPNIWHDVNRMRTLNSDQYQRNVEQHVCPLQFDIVDRLIQRYSNKGEPVYDPFGGLMTVANRAIRLGRRGLASELNTQYFMDGVHYLQAVERELAMPDLFAFEDGEAA